jgi:hypothetical protein
VNQRIDPVECLFRVVGHPITVGCLPDVTACVRHGTAGERLELGGHRGESLEVAVDQQDVSSPSEQQFAGGSSDAAGPAGYHDPQAGESIDNWYIHGHVN